MLMDLFMNKWAALAKMCTHTSTSLQFFHDTTALLGQQLCWFAWVFCPKFNTWETQRDVELRRQAAENQAKKTTRAQPLLAPLKAVVIEQQKKEYNGKTIKQHSIDDIAQTIAEVGTVNLYTTAHVR
jgi:hypothetical protein